MKPETLNTYVVTANGWTHRKWRKIGDEVKMTTAQAKYETVTLKPEDGPQVEIVGSLDDPLVKSSGLAEKASDETKKRSPRKK